MLSERSYLSRRLVIVGLCAATIFPQHILAKDGLSFTELELEDFGEVTRIIDGDSFVMSSGLRVRLSGIMAPEKRQAFYKQATQALDTLLSGRQIGLFYSGPKRDRYDRAVAQVYTLRPDGRPDQWVQKELIALGCARVRSYPESVWRNDVLLAEEIKAREAGRGLWQSSDFSVRTPAPNVLAQDVDSFQIIEGLIISTAQVRGQTYLNFGSDYRTDFTVSIARKHRKAFEAAGVDLMALEGARVRIRGWVELYNGPVIWLDHPDSLEELTPIVG